MQLCAWHDEMLLMLSHTTTFLLVITI